MKNSDLRIIEKFLWFPKTINGKMKWFCKAEWEEYFVDYHSTLLEQGYSNWEPKRWL